MCKDLIELALFENIAKKYEPYTIVVAAIELVDRIFLTKSEPSL